MSIANRKLSIINWISLLQDESVLEKIEDIQAQKPDWWETISEEEKQEIEDGIRQADQGLLCSSEEVMAKYRKWD